MSRAPLRAHPMPPTHPPQTPHPVPHASPPLPIRDPITPCPKNCPQRSSRLPKRRALPPCPPAQVGFRTTSLRCNTQGQRFPLATRCAPQRRPQTRWMHRWTARLQPDHIARSRAQTACRCPTPCSKTPSREMGSTKTRNVAAFSLPITHWPPFIDKGRKRILSANKNNIEVFFFAARSCTMRAIASSCHWSRQPRTRACKIPIWRAANPSCSLKREASLQKRIILI